MNVYIYIWCVKVFSVVAVGFLDIPIKLIQAKDHFLVEKKQQKVDSQQNFPVSAGLCQHCRCYCEGGRLVLIKLQLWTLLPAQ